MTRINSAISSKALTDEHLIAEHREITRLPGCLARAKKCNSISKIPSKFCLGKGHVLFFLDKMKFIKSRYKSLYDELSSRGINISDYSSAFDNIDSKFFNSYTPTPEELSLLTERITKRIIESNKKQWHYYKKPINKEEATSMLHTIDSKRCKP